MRRLGWVAAAVMAAAPAAAQQAPADTAKVHVVRPGDTLWDLSRQYLSDPFRWQEIFQLNRGRVEDPHRIFPREELRIPGLAERDASAVAPPPVMGTVAQQGLRPAGPAPRAVAPPRTVFFKPEPPPVGDRFREAAEAPVPLVTSGEFYAAGILVPEAEVRPLGILREPVSPTVVPMEMPAQIGLYDRVYMAIAVPGTIREGDRLHLMRVGRRVKPFGRVYTSTGMATVMEISGGTATVRVEQLFDAVTPGDVALPVPDYAVRAGTRPRPATGLEGRVVAFEQPQAVHSVRDLAFVDVGQEDGVTEGDEFVVVRPAVRIGRVVHPELTVARLRVVRSTPRTSAMEVIEMEYPAVEPGLPVRLVGKMP